MLVSEDAHSSKFVNNNEGLSSITENMVSKGNSSKDVNNMVNDLKKKISNRSPTSKHGNFNYNIKAHIDEINSDSSNLNSNNPNFKALLNKANTITESGIINNSGPTIKEHSTKIINPISFREDILKHTLRRLLQLLKESDEGKKFYQAHKDLSFGEHNVQQRITFDATNETKTNDDCIVILDIVIPEDANKEVVSAQSPYNLDQSVLSLAEFEFAICSIKHDSILPIFNPISVFDNLPSLVNTLLMPFLDIELDEETNSKTISPTIAERQSGIFMDNEIYFNDKEMFCSVTHNNDNLFRITLAINPDYLENKDLLSDEDIAIDILLDSNDLPSMKSNPDMSGFENYNSRLLEILETIDDRKYNLINHFGRKKYEEILNEFYKDFLPYNANFQKDENYPWNALDINDPGVILQGNWLDKSFAIRWFVKSIIFLNENYEYIILFLLI